MKERITMTPDQAVTHIRGMIFKPGWHLTARSSLMGSYVVVGLAIDTVDTSSPDPVTGRYTREVTLSRTTQIEVSSMNLEQLCAAILTWTEDIDSHENREFLQVRGPDGRWYSPLHPHTEQGEMAWMRGKLASLLADVRG